MSTKESVNRLEKIFYQTCVSGFGLMDHLSHRIKIILKKIAGLAFKPFLSVDLRQLFSKKKNIFGAAIT